MLFASQAPGIPLVSSAYPTRDGIIPAGLFYVLWDALPAAVAFQRVITSEAVREGTVPGSMQTEMIRDRWLSIALPKG